MRILLVEDERSLAKVIKLNLENEGYEVVWEDHGTSALQTVFAQHFDLVLLDVMLPGLNGYQVCEQIRLRDTRLPILFISARNTAIDRINGLKLGADDYIVKPFNLEELLLRVQIAIKRSPSGTKLSDQDLFSWDNFWINFDQLRANTLVGEVDLSAKENLLLKLFIEREGDVISREEILKTVWGYDVFPSTRTIDNFVLQFRKYFEENPRQPKYFKSIRGVGYKFVLPADHQ